MAGQVTYSEASFRQSGFVGGGQLVRLETTGPERRALSAFQSAIDYSNSVMEVREADGLWAQVQRPVPTPDGPAALVVDCEPVSALSMMLDTIARALENQGISGKLKPAPTIVDRSLGNKSQPALGALLLLPMREEKVLASYGLGPAPRPVEQGWFVDDATTRTVLAPVLDWVQEIEGPTAVYMGGVGISMSPEGVLDFVAAALPVRHAVTVKRTPHDGLMRQAVMDPYGSVTIHSYEPARDRSMHHAELSQLLRAVAAHVNSGFVRESLTTWSGRWNQLGLPPSTELVGLVRTGHWLLAHLEADYVYDAFVTQVFTGKQLSRITDLSSRRWTVEGLDGDRWLVTHAQPELWFSDDPRPPSDREQGWQAPVSPDVLAAARADLSPAIMTPGTLEALPPPLPRAEQLRALAPFGLRPE